MSEMESKTHTAVKGVKEADEERWKWKAREEKGRWYEEL